MPTDTPPGSQYVPEPAPGVRVIGRRIAEVWATDKGYQVWINEQEVPTNELAGRILIKCGADIWRTAYDVWPDILKVLPRPVVPLSNKDDDTDNGRKADSTNGQPGRDPAREPISSSGGGPGNGNGPPGGTA